MHLKGYLILITHLTLGFQQNILTKWSSLHFSKLSIKLAISQGSFGSQATLLILS